MQLVGQLDAVLNGEILLGLEARLELLELVVGERGASLALLALLALVAQNVLDEERGVRLLLAGARRRCAAVVAVAVAVA